jgi:hypothetical protein
MADINLGKVETHSAQSRDTGATARRWPIISRRTCHPTRRRRIGTGKRSATCWK